MRAYGEINDFEEQLTEAGGIVVKFWLTVTPEEHRPVQSARNVTVQKLQADTGGLAQSRQGARL